jgi:hypothetical protein
LPLIVDELNITQRSSELQVSGVQSFPEGKRPRHMLFSRIGFAAICASVAVLADAAPVQTFMNHVPQAVHQSRQMGRVDEAAHLNLAIGLPLRNREELDVLVEQIADPQSRNYRPPSRITTS